MDLKSKAWGWRILMKLVQQKYKTKLLALIANLVSASLAKWAPNTTEEELVRSIKLSRTQGSVDTV